MPRLCAFLMLAGIAAAALPRRRPAAPRYVFPVSATVH